MNGIISGLLNGAIIGAANDGFFEGFAAGFAAGTIASLGLPPALTGGLQALILGELNRRYVGVSSAPNRERDIVLGVLSGGFAGYLLKGADQGVVVEAVLGGVFATLAIDLTTVADTLGVDFFDPVPGF